MARYPYRVRREKSSKHERLPERTERRVGKQLWAERRLGELLAEQEKNKGAAMKRGDTMLLRSADPPRASLFACAVESIPTGN